MCVSRPCFVQLAYDYSHGCYRSAFVLFCSFGVLHVRFISYLSVFFLRFICSFSFLFFVLIFSDFLFFLLDVTYLHHCLPFICLFFSLCFSH